MKHTILFSFLLLNFWSALGQKNVPLCNIITLDTSLIYKQLPNGLRYYIKKNTKPEKTCLLRLVVNIGSLQEEDNERGIAHFVEHLAFNGTKNFPKRRIIEELELLGNKFGPDINAHTSFSETVYEIEVPTRTEAALDKGLAILHDWAFEINYEAEEVSKEIGVILAERRSRLSTLEESQRKKFQLDMNNARHCSRFPIGDSTIIANANAQLLKDFYQKWYRPDAMSILIVGDFQNAKSVENKLIQYFSTQPKPINAAPILTYAVPKSNDFKTLVLKDKEKTNFSFSLSYRHLHPFDSIPTVESYKDQVISSLAMGLINKYLSELPQKAEMPFLAASFRMSHIDNNLVDYSFNASLKENELQEGIKKVLKERLRLLQHQFNIEELEMLRMNYLKSYDLQIGEIPNIKHQQIIRNLFQILTNQQPLLDTKAFLQYAKKIVSEITLDEVNLKAKQIMQQQPSGYLFYWGVDKAMVQHPSDSSLLYLLQEVENEPITPIFTEKTNKTILEKLPTPEPYIKKKTFQLTEKEYEQPALFVTEYEYRNGARVVVLPTPFKEDEVKFSATSEGGISLASFENRFNAAVSSRIIGSSGLGSLSPIELNNVIFNKFVSLSPVISERHESLYGSLVQKDAAFFFQYLYAFFQMPRKDTLVFQRFLKAQKQNLLNANLLPSTTFYDSLSWFQKGYHPRAKPLEMSDLEHLNLDNIFQFYRERYQHGGDFIYFFVGSISAIPDFETFINTYIGSLSAAPKREKAIAYHYDTPKGKYRFEQFASSEPRNSVQINLTGKQKETRKAIHQLNMLQELLEQRLLLKLREDASAVYGVSVSSNIADGEFYINISFNCKPFQEQQLLDTIFQIIENIKTQGATSDELKKIVENRLKNNSEARKSNNSLLATLHYYYANDKDLSFMKNAASANEYFIKATPNDFKHWAKKYLKRNNEIIAILKAKSAKNE
jgi:zinc protease